MIKTIALTALAAVSVSAFAQGNANMTQPNNNWSMGNDHNWDNKYDTYNMASTDVNSLGTWQTSKLVNHSLKDVNAADAYTIKNFIELLPPDQSGALLKALAINYKQASIVRDEVAMARFGGDQSYAWLSYPPLTWSDTPGQNSWSAINFSTATPMMNNMNSDGTIAMTEDSSRAMRMVMARHGMRDIDYDRAVDILCSGLSDTERGALREVFHPKTFDPQSYTNAEELDAVIRVIESNAKMADNLGRYAWYNHFDKDYYSKNHSW